VGVGGEPEGFSGFVDAREQALQRTAWLLTGDWGLAEDLVQTALIRTWPRWDRIRRRDDPEVYVRRVMVNTWMTWTGVASPQRTSGVSRIYRFQLTRTGRIRGYVPVRGGRLTGPFVRDIAVTPDGAEVAVTVFAGQTQGPAALPEVIVINTRTGGHALWRSVRPVPGTIFYPVYGLSLTADGKELAFLSQPRCVRGRNAPKCHVRGGEEVRDVGHAATGGSLATARILLRQSQVMRLSTSYINAAVISPDGATITMAIVGNVSGPVLPDSVSIRQVASSGTRHLRIVYRMVTGLGFSYDAFGADPSVRHFLFDAGPASGTINGWVNHGRLVRLRPAGNTVNFEVW